MANEHKDTSGKLAFDILKIIHGSSNVKGALASENLRLKPAHEVANPIIKELPSIHEIFPFSLSTRQFTSNSSLEWIDFGDPGFSHSSAGALRDYEDRLFRAYSHDIEADTPEHRMITYTTSWEPYRSPNRVAFLVFSPATTLDSAKMNNEVGPASRPFLHMESKSMNLKQFNDLLNKGYPVLSATRPLDSNLLFIDTQKVPLTNGGKARLVSLPEGIRSGRMTERIDMSQGKILWIPDVLRDSSLIRSIASAYHKLRLFKSDVKIYFPRGTEMIPSFSDEKKTLISQALMHMLGKHFNWHSYEPNDTGLGVTRLGFSAYKGEMVRQDGQIKPELIEKTVATIHEVFSKPWPDAHERWKELKGSVGN